MTSSPGKNHYLLDAFPHLDLAIIIPSSKDLHISMDSKNYMVLLLIFYKLCFFVLCGYMCSPAARNFSPPARAYGCPPCAWLGLRWHVTCGPRRAYGVGCLRRPQMKKATGAGYVRFTNGEVEAQGGTWFAQHHMESPRRSGHGSPWYGRLVHFPPAASEPRPHTSWACRGVLTLLHTRESYFPGTPPAWASAHPQTTYI